MDVKKRWAANTKQMQRHADTVARKLERLATRLEDANRRKRPAKPESLREVLALLARTAQVQAQMTGALVGHIELLGALTGIRPEAVDQTSREVGS